MQELMRQISEAEKRGVDEAKIETAVLKAAFEIYGINRHERRKNKNLQRKKGKKISLQEVLR